MALEVINRIKQAEEEAQVLQKQATADAKKIIIAAQRQSEKITEKTENETLQKINEINDKAAQGGEFVMKKEFIYAEKECQILKEKSRQNINIAVKDCVERICFPWQL